MDKYKVLKNESITVDSASDVTSKYTVPSPAVTESGSVTVAPKAVSNVIQALATRLFVCNTHSSLDATFDVKVKSLAPDVTTTLYKSLSISNSSSVSFSPNLTLSSGDEFQVVFASSASAATVDVSIFGIEMITGSGPDA